MAKKWQYFVIIVFTQFMLYLCWSVLTVTHSRKRITTLEEAELERYLQRGDTDSKTLLETPYSSQSNLTDDPSSTEKPTKLDIAITLAITFKKLKDPSKSPLFTHLIPSFCSTASTKARYTFYIAHDHDDDFFKKPDSHKMFEQFFVSSFKNSTGTGSGLDISLRFVECAYSGKPAWAQNEASWNAYLHHHTYYYRVNDDTSIQTGGWLEKFIGTMRGFKPPNIGIVGPTNIGGAQHILTYEFTHRSHMDIFGYYYPRTFPDWWGDNWISQTYRPSRSIKVPGMIVKHTMQYGQRYQTSWKAGQKLTTEVSKSQHVVQQYIQKPIPPAQKPSNKPEKVIAMSLYGDKPRYTYGAIRNAILARQWFPGWTVRFYTEEPSQKPKYPAVPELILNKLRLEGAQILTLPRSIVENIPPMMWRFLTADDLSIKYFISRDVDSRLLPRDAIHVNDWLEKGSALHCARDHPSHSNFALSGGLWGAQPSMLRNLTSGKTMYELITSGSNSTFSDKYLQDMIFLNNILWPKVKQQSMCHDAFTCKSPKYPNSFPVLVKRSSNGEHLGQVYDEWGTPRQGDIDIIKRQKVVAECTP